MRLGGHVRQRPPQPDAHPAEREDHRVPAQGPHPGQQQQPRTAGEHAAGHQPLGTPPQGQSSGTVAGRADPAGQRQEDHPGVERRQPPRLLQIERREHRDQAIDHIGERTREGDHVELHIAEERQIDQRLRRAPFQRHEQYEGGDPDRDGGQGGRGGPPPALSLVDREHQAAEAEGHGRRAGQVETAGRLLVAGLGDKAQHQQRGGQTHRHIQQEHRTPADVFGEDTAHERPQRGADGAERQHRTDRPPLPVVAEVTAHHRHGNGKDQGRADALHDPGGNEPGRVLCGAAHHGQGGEHHQSDHDDPSPPVQIGGPATDDHQCADGHHVAADQPLEIGRRGAEIPGDDREHQVEREPVHLHDEHGQRGSTDHCPVPVGEGAARGGLLCLLRQAMAHEHSSAVNP